MKMQSTDFYRTLQSGYSELLGMMTEAKNPSLKLTKAQLKMERGAPKFNVRNSKKIASQLKDNATPEGFISVPIYTFMQSTWDDHLNMGDACNYVQQISNQLAPQDSSYSEALFTRDVLAQPFAVDFNNTV